MIQNIKKLFKFFLITGIIFIITFFISIFIIFSYDPWIIKKYLNNKFEKSNIVRNFYLENGKALIGKNFFKFRVNTTLENINFNFQNQSKVHIDQCDLSVSLLSLLSSTIGNNQMTCKNLIISSISDNQNNKNNTVKYDVNLEKIFNNLSSFFYDTNLPQNFIIEKIHIINNGKAQSYQTLKVDIYKNNKDTKKVFLHLDCDDCDKKKLSNSTIFITKEKAQNFFIKIKNFPTNILSVIQPTINKTDLFLDSNIHVNKKDSMINIDIDAKNIHGRLPNTFFYSKNPYIRINQGNFKSFVNNKKNLQIYEIQSIVDNILIQGELNCNLEKQEFKANINTKESINHKQIIDLMPKSISSEIFDFYEKSVLNGSAKNININTEFFHVNNEFFLKNIAIDSSIQDITFYEQNIKEKFENLHGDIAINNKNMQINIENGNFHQSKITKGQIKMDFYKNTVNINGKANIDLESCLKSNLYPEPIFIMDEKINHKLRGKAISNFDITFINGKLNDKNIQIASHDLSLISPIKQFLIHDSNISFSLKNNDLNILGRLNLENNDQIDFEFAHDIKNDTNILKINGEVDLNHLIKIDLLREMRERNFFIAKKRAILDIEIEKKDRVHIINAIANTTKSDITLDLINLSDTFGNESKLIIKNLILNEDKIEDNGIQFINSKHIFDIKIDYFLRHPYFAIKINDIADNSVNPFKIFINRSANKLHIMSAAKKIDINKLDFSIFNIQNDNKQNPAIEKITLINDIQELKLKNDIYIKNFYLKMVCEKEQCNFFSMEGQLAKSNITQQFDIYSEYNDENLCITTDNAGWILQGLGISQNIQKGHIKICIDNEFYNFLEDINGKIYMKKFKLHKTPLAIKFFSVVSLSGPLQILQQNGITFNYMNIPFNYNNKIFSIYDAFLSSHSVALSTNGALDFNNYTLNLRGVTFPMYGINRILAAFPILGDLFAGSGKKRGLIGINYYAKGSIDAPEFSANPLTIFAPGFIRDIVSSNNPQQSYQLPKKKFSDIYDFQAL